MISRTSFIITGLAAALVACAGAPREPAITAIPVIDGAYDFSGFISAAGAVSGSVSIAPDGRAFLSGPQGCGVQARINSRAVSVDCPMFSLHAFHRDGQLAPKATVRVTVYDPRHRTLETYKGTVDLRPSG